jgi:segregation and condensation protein B
MYYLPTVAEQLRRVARGSRCALSPPRVAVPPGVRSGRFSRGTAVFGPGGDQANQAAPPSDRPMRSVEAVLFLSREPVTSRKLAQVAQLADGTQARTLVRGLNEHYDVCGRAFRVEEVAGGYQLLSRPHLADWIRRQDHLSTPRRLSAPAMETLAVIAYRQPVMRAEVDAIRGVDCGEILRQLLDRDLVRVGGRSDELGRPYLYATTRRFLQWFGLRSLDDLPRAQLRRGHAAADRSDIDDSNPLHRSGHDDKESPVSVSAPTVSIPHDELERATRGANVMQGARADDDDFEEEEEDLEEDLDDDDDEEEEEEDFEDDDWEEVEDDEDEEEEEEDWDDEDIDDWDDEDEDDDEEEDDEDWE